MVLIFKIVGGHLETNRAVDMHTSAVELSDILESKSGLVYETNGIKRPGVLDENTMDGFDLGYGIRHHSWSRNPITSIVPTCHPIYLSLDLVVQP